MTVYLSTSISVSAIADNYVHGYIFSYECFSCFHGSGWSSIICQIKICWRILVFVPLCYPDLIVMLAEGYSVSDIAVSFHSAGQCIDNDL